MRHSALYFGTVTHRRLRPRRHVLRYSVFWMLLDLDEVPDIAERLLPFSYNRFNILSFQDRDHGDGSTTPLRAQIERILAGAGVVDCRTVRLLTMPRILGYAFNPISIYFCHRPDGSVAALLYEVHNTFGERHTYLYLGGSVRHLTHNCAKTFHVSPFLSMDIRYEFRTHIPDEKLSITIVGSDPNGTVIAAAMIGDRRPLELKQLLLAVGLYPLLTLKVIAAIHWNALMLWAKGVPVHTKPQPSSQAVTIIRSEGSK
jgi:uncharacterized protein